MATKWTNFDSVFHQEIPDCPGCYVVLIGNEVVYVGSSTRVASRISAHNFRPSIGGSTVIPWEGGAYHQHVSVKVRPTVKWGDWAMIELRLIKRLRPKYNIAGTDRKRRPSGSSKTTTSNWMAYR